jgi:VanZ family protein
LKKIIAVAILLTILAALLLTTLYFSSKTGSESFNDSAAIAESIENYISERFLVNHGDTFWKITLNQMLRRAAHIIEYFLIGVVLCTLLNVLISRVWLVGIISGIGCFFFGFFDEYRKQFIDGRHQSWVDTNIDFTSAIIGILIVTGVFALVRYIRKLRRHSLS